jgi:hypothetical protein
MVEKRSIYLQDYEHIIFVDKTGCKPNQKEDGQVGGRFCTTT